MYFMNVPSASPSLMLQKIVRSCHWLITASLICCEKAFLFTRLRELNKIYKMPQNYRFLCGNFFGQAFIYAVKFDQYPWHYFDEEDTSSSKHGSLPVELENVIKSLSKVKTVELALSEEQAKNYFENGKFVFNNKELKTCKCDILV